MASIRERNGKFNVIYSYTNEKGERKQKWETYETKAEAKRRKKEIEYKKEMGSFVVRKCKTLDELITEYVALYGKENWALSTYEGNVSLINNYILPVIGDAKLSEINTRFIERYYQSLLKRRAVINPLNKTSRNEFVSSSTVRDVNKLLRNCFEQAVKWELMEKNPCTHATVPKHKSQKRDIWTADTLMYALSVCEDERLKLAINLSFSCSLRLGELLGLTWDCVDISPEAIEENRAYVFINKESQRIRKESLNALDGKDVLLVFPTNHKKNSTVRILKTPKTESSVRKIFLPKSVANMLVEWKAEQDEMKEILGDEYMDYNLVMASTFGLPLGDGAIRGPLKKLIEDYNLPPVVFHSFRHSSVTYKLKLNGGDIKAVQGDSGHSQVNMVTDVYSHILDDDRRKNAELFEEAFYENPIISVDEKRFDSDNRSEDYQAYENLVKETIDYESLEVTHHDDMRQVDEIVNLIVETVMCKNDKILIASNWYPASLVKKKFLMLTYSHIEYVLHCMSGNTTKVKNIKKYLLAALFNAPSTMNGYYQAEVNHDMPGLVR